MTQHHHKIILLVRDVIPVPPEEISPHEKMKFVQSGLPAVAIATCGPVP